MNEVIKILMRRDGLSVNEAQNVFDDVRAQIWQAIDQGNLEECEEILACELSLEPDYLDEFIY